MTGAWLARVRWRRRGAWLWPMFAVLTIVDAVVGHELPPAGDTQTLVAAALLGFALNLVGVIVLSFPAGALIRRVRGDLPMVVARDYGGVLVVAGIAVALIVVGAVHHSTVLHDRSALREATVRAEAWIAYRAPAEFRRNAALVNTFTIEPGNIYRSCVPSSRHRSRNYCVIVKPQLPMSESVRYAGSEPNWLFSEGAG